MRQVLSDRLDDAADMASIAARPQSPDEVSPLQIEILTPEIADLGPEPLSTEPSSPSKKAILSAANSLGLQLNPDKVGPHNFAKIRNLGAGSSGRVYLVKSIGLPTEEYYAMKVVKKSELVRKNRVQRILTERQILSVANHPFIVTLHYSFQTTDYFYFIMQYCAGGEFFSFLKRQEKQRLSEAQARFYAAEVLLALEYLHLLGIIYRDLKPENILVHESGHVVLSDFDLAHDLKTKSGASVSPLNSFVRANWNSISQISTEATATPPPSPVSSTPASSLWFRIPDRKTSSVAPAVVPQRPSVVSQIACICACGRGVSYPMMDTESHLEQGERRTSFVGTHEYVAPEIIAEEGYVGSVDWWAFGILLYEMVYSTTPFKGSTQIETLENILDLTGDIDFPSEIPVSDTFKDLIRQLLAKHVSRRLQNPLHIKVHPFFKGTPWSLIRHQTPPIAPTFVHALEERAFSQDQIDGFDNEVPYLKGVNSPNSPKRLQQSKPVIKRYISDVKTAEKEAHGTESTASCSLEKFSENTATRLQTGRIPADVNPLSSGDSLHSSDSAATNDFEYSGNRKREYWSSSESNRMLSEKLRELQKVSKKEPESLTA